MRYAGAALLLSGFVMALFLPQFPNSPIIGGAVGIWFGCGLLLLWAASSE